jgi:hypothetical protein
MEKLKGERGEVHKKLWHSTDFYLQHKTWGICTKFDKTDVRTIVNAGVKLGHAAA